MTATLNYVARWPLLALQRAYLGWLIRQAEGDVAYMEHQIAHAATLHEQIAVHRQHIGALRARQIGLQ